MAIFPFCCGSIVSFMVNFTFMSLSKLKVTKQQQITVQQQQLVWGYCQSQVTGSLWACGELLSIWVAQTKISLWQLISKPQSQSPLPNWECEARIRVRPDQNLAARSAMVLHQRRYTKVRVRNQATVGSLGFRWVTTSGIWGIARQTPEWAFWFIWTVPASITESCHSSPLGHNFLQGLASQYFSEATLPGSLVVMRKRLPQTLLLGLWVVIDTEKGKQ